MSVHESYRTLGNRIAAALRTRVGNGRAVTVKHLTHALQVSEQTVWNLLSGNNDPSGRVLMALLTFFDESFAAEILEPTGLTVAKLSDRKAAALRKVAEGMEELRRMA